MTLLSLSLAACSGADGGGDVPSASVPVAFSALAGWDGDNAAGTGGTRQTENSNSTRLAENSDGKTVFGSDDRIGVFAYYNDSSTPDFMNNQEVAYDGTAWTYSPVKYWPANDGDRLSFYGYSPYSPDMIKVTSTDNGKPTIAYDNVDGRVDWMAADNTGVGYANGKDGVEMKFKHLLARVKFKFTIDDTYDFRPVVHMMEYNVPHYKASFSYEYDEATGKPVYTNNNTPEYQDGAVTIRRFVSVPDGITITNQGTFIDDFTVYLYPCSFPCGDSKDTDGTFTFTLNNVKHTFSPGDKIDIIEKGCSYTVNFKIKPSNNDTDFFITSYSIWKDGGEYDGNLE